MILVRTTNGQRVCKINIHERGVVRPMVEVAPARPPREKVAALHPVGAHSSCATSSSTIQYRRGEEVSWGEGRGLTPRRRPGRPKQIRKPHQSLIALASLAKIHCAILSKPRARRAYNAAAGGSAHAAHGHLPSSVSCVNEPESRAQWRTINVSPVVSGGGEHYGWNR
jgi:hypothetical protein